MPGLRVELHVHARDRRFVTVPELSAGTGMPLDPDPNGGLAITDDVEMILVDDLLDDVAGFFFDELPDLLRDGQGGTYKFRTGPETTSVALDGEAVWITGYDGTQLQTTVALLLAGLEAAQRDYEALQQLMAKA